MKTLSVGVDVSEKTVDVAYWDQDENEPVWVGKYPNNHKGFQAIGRKIEKRRKDINASTVHLVMEPSGGSLRPPARMEGESAQSSVSQAMGGICW